jgi:hypothetical protein
MYSRHVTSIWMMIQYLPIISLTNLLNQICEIITWYFTIWLSHLKFARNFRLKIQTKHWSKIEYIKKFDSLVDDRECELVVNARYWWKHESKSNKANIIKYCSKILSTESVMKVIQTNSSNILSSNISSQWYWEMIFFELFKRSSCWIGFNIIVW